MHFTIPMKAILWLALLHAGSATADGISTKYWEHQCRTCFEIDPIARPFIGRRPTWTRMTPAGALEVGAAAFVGYELKKHRVKIWWLPQVAFIAGHTYWAVSNYRRH